MGEDERLALATLGFLESAYAWGRSDEAWLKGVLDAACEVWGADDWAYAHFYDASQPGRFAVSGAQTRDVPGPIAALIIPWTESLPPEAVERMHRRAPCGFGSSLGSPKQSLDLLRGFGKADLFGLNGLDPEGFGCVVCIGTTKTVLTPSEYTLFQRLAAHLASAYRLRRRLQAGVSTPLDGAEVVLDLDANILEATGPARFTAAQQTVRSAARSMQRVRRERAGGDPSGAWVPRVATRWTMVDAQDARGCPVIVARDNQAKTASLDSLTEREKQVVASAAYGRSNKEIAYELGISHSTARVLLARACARLGVRSRSELLELPALRAMRGA